MSSSKSASLDSDGYSLFDREITQDWSVCNNCFARTHIVHAEYDPAELPQSLRRVVTSDIERTTSATTDYLPNLVAADCRRTMCGECGSDRRTILKRPVSEGMALSFAQNLTERVIENPELSIEDDGDLVDEVERLKAKREYQRDNNYLYDRAFNNVVRIDMDSE